MAETRASGRRYLPLLVLRSEQNMRPLPTRKPTPRKAHYARRLLAVVGMVGFLCSASHSVGFGIFNATGLNGGSRWDAAPRTLGGVERSLDGGLRFSLQGGSYQSYRDLFSWSGPTPSVASFEQAVLEAFAFWTMSDPQTDLGTTLKFVPDLATPVSRATSGSVRLGAEIDLFGAIDGAFWDPGDSGNRAEAFFDSVSVSGNLKLTSGTTNYPGFAISGADITFNTNPGAQYSLTSFRTILTHEIGHTLGFADVDITSGASGTFIDDNLNASNSQTALATLTNSYALLINPFNPAASPLQLYTVADGDPGFDTSGVDILMESSIPEAFFGTGLSLSNDDFAGRQFMYPVPEPASTMLLLFALFLCLRRFRLHTQEPGA